MVAATRPARALLALALLHVGAALDQSAWPPRPRALLATSVLEGVFRPGLRLGATRTEGAVSRHRGREQATEPTEPLGSILGPGTLVGALHVFNKALMCWCTDARVRDMVVKVAAPLRPGPSRVFSRKIRKTQPQATPAGVACLGHCGSVLHATTTLSSFPPFSRTKYFCLC